MSVNARIRRLVIAVTTVEIGLTHSARYDLYDQLVGSGFAELFIDNTNGPDLSVTTAAVICIVCSRFYWKNGC